MLTKTTATLGTTDISEAVKIPNGETLFQWLTVNSIDFYNMANFFYASLCENCTISSCPIMSAGNTFIYMWRDKQNEQYKNPTEICARQYMRLSICKIEQLLSDKKIFPEEEPGL